MNYQNFQNLMLLISSDNKRTLMHLLLFTNSAQTELVSICTQSIHDHNKLSLPYTHGTIKFLTKYYFLKSKLVFKYSLINSSCIFLYTNIIINILNLTFFYPHKYQKYLNDYIPKGGCVTPKSWQKLSF